MIAKKFNYDIGEYDFKRLLTDLYQVQKLEHLHLELNKPYEVAEGVEGLGKDTDSEFHTMFYKKIRSGWKKFNTLYVNFINKIVLPELKYKQIVYQTSPSYRIQYPMSKAITTLHCDSDENHKHPLGEINVLIPITEMFDTTAIWSESEPNKGDFLPMNCSYGQFYIWNGNECRHYNKQNKSEITRISMDFRILPTVFYDQGYSKTSATSNKKFIIGEYYSTFGDKNV